MTASTRCWLNLPLENFIDGRWYCHYRTIKEVSRSLHLQLRSMGIRVPKNMFSNFDDAVATLQEFLNYRNVYNISIIRSTI